jgi:hypothetical protein
MIKNAVVTGLLMGTLFSNQVIAGEAACLTRSRLVSTRPIDENTIEMTDRLMNRYIVRMQNACDNLNYTNAKFIFRFWGNLSCLNSSVSINVTAPGRGARTCRVASVEAASPSG